MIKEIPMPLRGVNRAYTVDKTSPEFCDSMNNVFPFDTLEGRMRFGKRPGLKKWGEGSLVGGAELPVVAMCIVSTIE